LTFDVLVRISLD